MPTLDRSGPAMATRAVSSGTPRATAPREPGTPPAGRPASGAGTLPSITLPKGGGAIGGIGEKFAVNPATGTGSVTIPLPLSAGRSGFTPHLLLTYDTGAGNGPFGFGWNLSLPSITRKTSMGLPRYRDGDESDVFLLAGAEDLVPVLDGSGRKLRTTRTLHGTTYEVAAYRPRVDTLFSRLEHWTATDSGISHWRSITRDDVTSLYGFAADSRIADPANPQRIYSYRLCRTWDDRGNMAVYEYRQEDGAGVDTALAHEANRTSSGRAAQWYLKRVRYGNVQPYRPDWTADGTEAPLPTQWLFGAVLDYGDHAPDTPTPAPDRAWPVRPDPFSSYRSGFEVRTYRRVQRILMFHDFPAEPEVGADCLVRSLDLTYADQQAPVDPGNPIYSFLAAARQTGYRRTAGGYLSRSLPPLEFDYSRPALQPDVLSLDPASSANLPEGLDGARYRWADLDGDGVSGVLMAANDGAWGYKRNLSPNNQISLPDGSQTTRARLGPLEGVATLPSAADLGGRRQLLDLSGDGRLDLVDFAGAAPGYFKRDADAGWAPFRTFASLPDIDWSEPDLRFVDLTGDGLPDILITEDGLFTAYPSLGEAGFGPAELVPTPWDEERGPKVVLADGTQTVFLADMSGDGLGDLVRVRNGETCYWPSTGYGRFGAKVTMDGAPRFGAGDQFDPRRVRLADIDGSGTADLLYVGPDGVQVCFNQSGNAWAPATRIAVFPGADDLGTVQVVDLLGTGTACLVWSSPLPGERRRPLRYVDLMGGRKPHLLTRASNNLGAETRLSYTPSTFFALADREAGRPWVTRLPFPVQVVERVEVIDWIGRNRTVTRYAYHHGHFDGYEREFRGFGMVEQWDSEEYRADTVFPEGAARNWDAASWSPPILTRTWFHTGAFAAAGAVSQQYAAEYWTEPALRQPGRAADRAAMLLPDTQLPADLQPEEVREAYRALKGRTLRREVFAEDGSPRGQNPYSVSEYTFLLRRLQPKSDNRHAVFLVNGQEAVTLHYERSPDDPRVTHDITLEVDDFGNVRRSVAVGYARRAGSAAPEPALSAAAQSMLAYDQTRLHVVATEHQYTNGLTDPVALPDTHRLPLPAATITAELTGISPVAGRAGITNLFAFAELQAVWSAVWDGTHDIPYESVPAADIDGGGTLAGAPTRRIVRQDRTLYRHDDLTALLPLGQLETLALPGESYRAALTPGLLTGIFGALAPDATLTEGGYVPLPAETGWWRPSGRLFYSPDAADTPAQELAQAGAHFFLPRRAVDPFGASRRIDYDGDDLLATATIDPAGNVTAATNDYRVLQPTLVTDPNGNRSAVAFDALGFVAGSAVMGKATETLGDSLAGFVADLDEATLQGHIADPLTDPGAILGTATTRLVYDRAAYYRTRAAAQPAPPVVYTLARETHVSDLLGNQSTNYQHSFAYSDGYQRVIQRKVRAEAGPLIEGGPVVTPRWTGSGWTIFNNKGKPVRRYEPFFSAANTFEFAVQAGVSTILFYDPPGRAVATLHPDNTWEKVVVGGWRQDRWDGNDTTLISDPRGDPDVGDYFRRLLGSAPNAFVSWHDLRSGGTYGATADDRAAQQDAAQKAAAHAGTPTSVHFDALGRTCLTVQDNGGSDRQTSRLALDVEGKPLAIFDALGRRVMEYCLRLPQDGGGFRYLAGTDMAGNPLYRIELNGGARRSMHNVAGNLFRAWDARGHAFRMRYDLLQRPTHHYVSTNGAAEILLERSVYGDGLPAANLCGRLFRRYDCGGVAINAQYDFKGNLLASRRQLANDYRQSVDWSPLANLTDAAALDAAAAPLLAAADTFAGTSRYDALNRPIQVVTPHSAAMRPNVLRPLYSEANLLAAIHVWQQTTVPAALLDPTTADLHAVTALSYNARGQSTRITYGNGTLTNYNYDPATFRLARLTTTRPGSFAASMQVVQDLIYFDDPAGNITRIRDMADTQNVIYFRNQRVEPTADYTYDPLYRLIRASGREHLGQAAGVPAAPQQIGDDDSFRTGLPQPGDGNAMGVYIETYTYDPAGNLLAMLHQVSSGAWTRRYAYDEPSPINAGERSNRLSATSLPGDPAGGPFSATYAYDAHGNTVRMPHLPALTWDEADRLRSTVRQVVNGATPVTTFYAYDGSGQRLRKTTDRQAPAGQPGSRRTERVYLGAVEIYRTFAADGATLTLQRETLHIDTAAHPIALVETRTFGADPAPAQLIRYQHTNHLNSATLELDDQAQIISYEEYFPYGSTSYQAVRSQTDTPKRYRYTDQERDEENGCSYHGARYYAPWLGRWTSCDPAGLVDSLNLYAYVRDNPVRRSDPTGRQGNDQQNNDEILYHYEYVPPDPSGRPSPELKLVFDGFRFDPPVIPPPPPPAPPTQGATAQPPPQDPRPISPLRTYRSATGRSPGSGSAAVSSQGSQVGSPSTAWSGNTGIFSQPWGGMEATASFTAITDTSGTVTGGGPAVGGHIWWSPATSRNNVGGYLTLNQTWGASPSGQGLNLGAAGTAVYERLFGGRDRNHPLLTLGVNANLAYQEFAHVTAAGSSAHPRPSAFLGNALLLGAGVSGAFNLGYYGDSKTPRLTIFAESFVSNTSGTGVSAGNGAPPVPGETTAITGALGALYNFRLDNGSVILSVGATVGGRAQWDTVNGTTTTATGAYGGAVFGVAF